MTATSVLFVSDSRLLPMAVGRGLHGLRYTALTFFVRCGSTELVLRFMERRSPKKVNENLVKCYVYSLAVLGSKNAATLSGNREVLRWVTITWELWLSACSPPLEV